MQISILPETLIGSKSTCPTVIFLSFHLRNNNCITNLQLLSILEMGMFHARPLTVGD